MSETWSGHSKDWPFMESSLLEFCIGGIHIRIKLAWLCCVADHSRNEQLCYSGDLMVLQTELDVVTVGCYPVCLIVFRIYSDFDIKFDMRYLILLT